MKKLVHLFIVSSFLLPLQGISDTIYAKVNADTATIWHEQFHTSCSSSFMMNFEINDFEINVYEVDTSGGSYCLCYYDLNTVIGGLNSGEYLAKVYVVDWMNYPFFKPSDTMLAGTTSFVIENQPPAIPVLLSNHRSDCYENVSYSELAKRKDPGSIRMKIIPNPINTKGYIKVEIDKPDFIKLALLDNCGKMISVLQNSMLEKGDHLVYLDTSKLAQRVYFILLSGSDVFLTEKTVIIQ